VTVSNTSSLTGYQVLLHSAGDSFPGWQTAVDIIAGEAALPVSVKIQKSSEKLALIMKTRSQAYIFAYSFSWWKRRTVRRSILRLNAQYIVLTTGADSSENVLNETSFYK